MGAEEIADSRLEPIDAWRREWGLTEARYRALERFGLGSFVLRNQVANPDGTTKPWKRVGILASEADLWMSRHGFPGPKETK